MLWVGCCCEARGILCRTSNKSEVEAVTGKESWSLMLLGEGGHFFCGVDILTGRRHGFRVALCGLVSTKCFMINQRKNVHRLFSPARGTRPAFLFWFTCLYFSPHQEAQLLGLGSVSCAPFSREEALRPAPQEADCTARPSSRARGLHREQDSRTSTAASAGPSRCGGRGTEPCVRLARAGAVGTG